MARPRFVRIGRGLFSFGVGLLLGCMALGAVRPAAAGDPPRPDARAATTAAALEAANLRAKVKLELARLLDREGRTEEAMAALLEADRILTEAARLAAELDAPPKTPAPAGPRVPLPGSPAPGRKPFLLGPIVAGPSAVPVPSRLMPRRDPVPSAVRYLLGRQGVDGSFDGLDGLDGANPNIDAGRVAGRNVAVTAWALLALAEVATGDGPAELGPVLLDRATTAAGRAAGFLLVSTKDDGAMAASTEDHCLAGWAVAAALSRLGPRLVTLMPKEFGITTEMVDRKLGAALRRALAGQDAATGRLSTAGTIDEQALAAIAFIGFLHEVEPLPLARPFLAIAVDSLETARVKAAAAFSGPLTEETTPKTPAGREVLALLRHDRKGIASSPAGPGAADPIRLLFGTVSASSLGSEADWEAWWQDVLVPAMNTQALGGVEVGSFPSGPERLGRTHATALSLLAWLYPDMEWLAPAQD